MRHPTLRRLATLLTALSLSAIVFVPVTASAATAVAISDTYTRLAFAGKGESPELAERAALAICDVEMRKGGIAPACRVFVTEPKRGFYAVACGQLGCGASLGQKTLRAAQENAYDKCYELQKFCNNDLSAYGNDVAPAPRRTPSTKN